MKRLACYVTTATGAWLGFHVPITGFMVWVVIVAVAVSVLLTT